MTQEMTRLSIFTDHHSGHPYIMWKGAPDEHIMMPAADFADEEERCTSSRRQISLARDPVPPEMRHGLTNAICAIR